MTVSAITTITFGLNELIAEAFDIIGVGTEGEAITADMYRRGRNSAVLMTQSWNAQEDLWRHGRVTVTPITDTATYILTPKPMRVTSAVRKTLLGGNEIPMTQWARQEYLDQPNKTGSPSTPVNYYYDPQRDVGTLFVWPPPSSAVAPTISIIVDTLRQMFIMDLTNQTLDMPAEWQETYVYNLAKRLKLKYPVNDPNLSAQVDAMADDLLAKLNGWDNEPVSLYLQPDYFGTQGYGEWR
jgi:hypothetical protein